MRHINGAYTTYFNTKQQRTGHLFQGRYKAILIDADAYAQELSRYIHLNPVRAGSTKRPEDFLWSRYRYFIGEQEPPAWLTTELILGYFGKRTPHAWKKYRKFVDDLIDREGNGPLEKTVASTILGGADVVTEITKKYLNMKRAVSDRS